MSHIGVESPEDNIRITIVEPGIVETELPEEQERELREVFGEESYVPVES